MHKLFIYFFFAFLSSSSLGQNFSNLIDSVYNFKPTELNKNEKELVFPKLDSFFNKIINDSATYVPLLKEELKKDGHFPYFYYDAAHLLMIINKNNTIDDELIINSFLKSEIKELDPKVFTFLLSRLALRGANTSDIAINILRDTTFSFFLPDHFFNFNQGYCISYILLPLNTSYYITKLIANFNSFSDYSKKSIITTLWFSYSCEGDKFLTNIIEDTQYSENVRNYARDLMSRKKVDSKIKKIMKELYGSNLDKIWFDSLNRFSDEAIGNIDYVTRMRRLKEDCK